MRQVNKEEFEVLTRFHPGEVRYYVDISKAVNRNKGARVNVKRKPMVNRKPKTPIKAVGFKLSHSNSGRFVQLTVNGAASGDMQTGTKQYKVYSTVTRLLESDPTKVIKRTELTSKLVDELPQFSKNSVIVPAITALLRLKRIRYVGQ